MSKNVTNLRKAGNLNEAFRVAQAALDARPDDVWCKKDMAWVLYDFAKQKMNYALCIVNCELILWNL